jgi:putative NIF3 family GTP cyclohydrolase 1 type 2
MGLRNVETPLMARCARIANLEKRMSSLELMEMVGASLNIGNIRVVGDNDGEISRVFVAAGSGMSYFQDALAGAVHAIITGDVKYHPAREALYKGVTIIDAGHFGLEKHFKDLVAQRLTNGLSKSGFAIECVICDCEMDPFGAAIV